MVDPTIGDLTGGSVIAARQNGVKEPIGFSAAEGRCSMIRYLYRIDSLIPPSASTASGNFLLSGSHVTTVSRPRRKEKMAEENGKCANTWRRFSNSRISVVGAPVFHPICSWNRNGGIHKIFSQKNIVSRACYTKVAREIILLSYRNSYPPISYRHPFEAFVSTQNHSDVLHDPKIKACIAK